MDNRDNNPGLADSKTEKVMDNALGKHDSHPGVADHVGEAAGGISGVLAGAAIGSVVGPIGTIIGGIAGAMGGWWTGRAVAEAATAIGSNDDSYYRNHYETSSNRLADRGYEEVKPAYYMGHVASRNPDYKGRSFNEVEGDLKEGWTADANRGSWEQMRGYAQEGYGRGTSTMRNAGERAMNAADDMKDRVDGNPASRPGPDATDR